MLKVSFIQRLVIFCKDSNYIAAYSELIYKKIKKEMQSFALSLVTFLHITFNNDKVTMENHNNTNDITSHRKLHLQTNAMLW
jgi:hypothetical protein